MACVDRPCFLETQIRNTWNATEHPWREVILMKRYGYLFPALIGVLIVAVFGYARQHSVMEVQDRVILEIDV